MYQISSVYVLKKQNHHKKKFCQFILVYLYTIIFCSSETYLSCNIRTVYRLHLFGKELGSKISSMQKSLVPFFGLCLSCPKFLFLMLIVLWHLAFVLQISSGLQTFHPFTEILLSFMLIFICCVHSYFHIFGF